MERRLQDFVERPKCWTTQLVKQKITLMGRCQPIQKVGKIYGRRIRLTDQPRKGLRWQAQDKILLTARATRRPEITNERVHGPG